jgi:quaternary ammonium compound-resistance protein SugE
VTGMGAALAVAYSMVAGLESASLPKLLFLSGIVGCAVGLKLFDPSGSRRDNASVMKRKVGVCLGRGRPKAHK